MGSAPSAVGVKISSPLFEFFQVELRNEEIMRSEADDDGYDEDAEDYVPPSTLGSAYDSLAQAPDDVIGDWVWSHLVDDPENHSVTAVLIEFGTLLGTYGDAALLTEFKEQT